MDRREERGKDNKWNRESNKYCMKKKRIRKKGKKERRYYNWQSRQGGKEQKNGGGDKKSMMEMVMKDVNEVRMREKQVRNDMIAKRKH